MLFVSVYLIFQFLPNLNVHVKLEYEFKNKMLIIHELMKETWIIVLTK